MGKAERNRRQSAQQKIAAQRAAARSAERRRQIFISVGSAIAVIAVVVTFIVLKNVSQPGASQPTADNVAVSQPAVAKSVVTVPASTLNAVGIGSAAKLTPETAASLTVNGKPDMLYIGAEYCPYCAAERWAMAVALSRFGALSGVHFIHSSSTDVYPSTPTMTFYKSSYDSKYLSFTPVEWYSTTPSGSGYKTLQAPSKAQLALMTKYDSNGYFPFIDIDNKYIDVGAQYVPSNLKGLTWAQVAGALKNPSSPIAKEVDGAANILTAAICKATNGKPGKVCTSPAVTAGNGGL